MASDPYNPLDKINLANSVAGALLRQKVRPLGDAGGIVGAGVYAIYYTGGFPAYAPITERNRDGVFFQPIYVGKAIPKGGRKGGLGMDSSKGTALSSRLKKHAGSIDAANNLDIADFHFRCLVVDDIWIPLGENILIEELKPVWNMVVDGFGINDPGSGRYNQARSQWDVLHSGRGYADKLKPGKNTIDEITRLIADFFAGRFQPTSPVDSGDGDD